MTSSYVAKSDNFKNILIAAPTVMDKNVLRKKLIQNVDGSKISYSTVSKLLAIPTEIIEVMNNTYQLDKSGMDKLRQMMTKLKMDHSDVIIERDLLILTAMVNVLKTLNISLMSHGFVKNLLSDSKGMVKSLLVRLNRPSILKLTI